MFGHAHLVSICTMFLLEIIVGVSEKLEILVEIYFG